FVMLDGFGNRFALVTDVEHIVAAFAPGLARPDVYNGHSQERAFPYAHARVADETSGVVNQSKEIRGSHVLEEVDIRWILLLAESPDPVRSAVRTRIHVWPEP